METDFIREEYNEKMLQKFREEASFINEIYGLCDDDHDTALERGHIYEAMHKFVEKKANQLESQVDVKIVDIARQKYEFIISNRENLIEAFIAETGLLPSECVMIEQEMNELNFIGTKIYFKKR